MKITKAFLQSEDACDNGIAFWESLGSPSSPVAVFRGALASREFGYCEWLLSKCLPDRRAAVELAVFAAELCLPLFERDYPNDGRPREAIAAAKVWLADPSEANLARCRVASSAASSAASSFATYFAAYSAWSAAAAAWSAASSYFAAAAAWSAAAAANGDPARLATCEKIGAKFEEIHAREKPVKKTSKKKSTTNKEKTK